MKNLAISLIPLVIGALLGSSFTKLYYERELTKIHNQYVKSIQEARTIEDKLREKANELEIKYQKDLEAASAADRILEQMNKGQVSVDEGLKNLQSEADSIGTGN